MEEVYRICSKYPWFVVQNLEDEEDVGDEIYSTLHDPLIKYECEITEKRRIRACCHGWLILSNHPYNDSWSLWNPETSKMIYLPRLILKNGDGKSICECCLTAPPDDPDSVLLLTRSDRSTFVFCQLGNESWSEMSYAKQLKRLTYDGKLLRSLTYCNGKIYALNAKGYFDQMVLQVEVVVVKEEGSSKEEVMIQLLVFGPCPDVSYYRCIRWVSFLKGYGTKLFIIRVGLHDETKKFDDVYLFNLDTTSIKWEEMECLNNLDWTCILPRDVQLEYLKDLEVIKGNWKRIDDLKDDIFYVDLGRDKSIFYYNHPEIGSEELGGGGGYIHIRDNLEEGVINLYHVKDRTVIPFSMPSRVVSTTHVFMWEGRCRLEDDPEAANYTTVNSNSKQEEEDGGIVVRSTTTSTTYDEAELNESSCRLVTIPFDVLKTIMDNCVGLEYMNFRATCKLCHLAAPVITTTTTTRLLHNYSLDSPWLMVVDENRRIISFKDPMTGNNYYMKKSKQVVVNSEIICCRFGWLLFDSGEYECYECCLVLFNPFKNDVRKLPKMYYKLKGLCFSAEPTSPNCIVAGFTTSVNHCRVIFHLVNRESIWRALRVGPSYSICCSTFYGRDLYALCTEGQLIVLKNFSGKKEDYSCKIFKAEAPPSLSSSTSSAAQQNFLVKCDQLLLLVGGTFGQVVEVFAFNHSSDEWKRIDSVEKHMIYICGKMCLCVEAKKPEMENKIYFPHLHWKNGNIFCYSLETRKYHTFNGKTFQGSYHDFSGTIHHKNVHAWIEPTWT